MTPPTNLASYRWPIRVGDRARVIGSDASGRVAVLSYHDGRPCRALIQIEATGTMVAAAPEQVEAVHG